MKEMSAITMKDIARELNVSVATVSRALKNSPCISLQQRERIQAYAREHEFYPNFIAESLQQQDTTDENYRCHHSRVYSFLFFFHTQRY